MLLKVSIWVKALVLLKASTLPKLSMLFEGSVLKHPPLQNLCCLHLVLHLHRKHILQVLRLKGRM